MRRLSTVFHLRRKVGTKGILITHPVHVRYLTGLPLDDARLLILPRRIILYVSVLDRQPAEGIAQGIALRDTSRLATDMALLRSCAFESEYVTVSRLFLWKRRCMHTKFVRFSGLLEECRRSKDPDELRCIRRAERITRELLRRIPAALRTSISEEELARRLKIWALELGADGMAFPPIVGFGPSTGTPHHRPGSRRLKKGDIVQIDVGAKFGGYCSDASDVFFTSRPTSDQQRIYGAVSEAQQAALKAVRPGVTNRALDLKARSILKREGIEDAFCHSLGHGVGLDIHEGVSLSHKAKEMKLLKNEVITIEPGVYFPGKWGMRVEKIVIV